MTPNLWFHLAFLFSFCSNFFATWQQGKKKEKKREGSGAGLELMHATDLFEKKRFQIRHNLRKKNFEITKSKI